MDKIYNIKLSIYEIKTVRIKAENARAAMEMLLNTYFKSNIISLDKKDIQRIDLTSEGFPEGGVDECRAACERFGDGFGVFIDGEECDFMDDLNVGV